MTPHEKAQRSFDTYYAAMLASVDQHAPDRAEVYAAMKPYLSHAYRSGWADGGVAAVSEVADMFEGHPGAGSVKP